VSAGPEATFAGRGAALTAEERIWRILETVPDPEIPVVSIVDLGIVRYVRSTADGRLHVGLTPTYCGCPATAAIRTATAAALKSAGYADAQLEEVLAPAWTSDWVTPAGRARLAAFGIAPPVAVGEVQRGEARAVSCPRCASNATDKVSEFGSTPCKAHYRCSACGEPFDQFKCI
jgi:ring-1,2-phenylacetyl-CoA epoxidase subunit PaaD